MYSIETIKTEYQRLDAITGQDIAKTIPIEIVERELTTRGAYQFRLIEGIDVLTEKIVFNSFVMNEDAETFYNTIRHEYAHAFATRKYLRDVDHGKEWQECAKIVGANPEAHANFTKSQKKAISNMLEMLIAMAEDEE